MQRTLNYQKLSFLFSCLVLVGCASSKPIGDLPVGREETRKENFGKLFGPEFLVFGKPDQHSSQIGGAGMSANPYLWKAALETLSFMPLVSADAVGGIIVTDWHASEASRGERLKVTVQITDRQLRADAVKVLIHKEIFRDGRWVSATSDPAIARQMEDIILSKARDLKIQQKQKA